MKKFTKWEISVIKTTAKNVSRFYDKQHKISEKIAELQKEFESVDSMIESFERPVRELTNGYSTADLLDKVVRENGSVAYTLKYPETVVPVEGKTEELPAPPEAVEVEMPEETIADVLAETPVAPQSQPVQEVEDLPVDETPSENSEIAMEDVKESVDNEDPFFAPEEASEIDF